MTESNDGSYTETSEESDWEGNDGEDDRRSFASRALGALMGLIPPQREVAAASSLADRFRRLPLPAEPLRHELAWRLGELTSGVNPPSHACPHVRATCMI